MNRRQFGYLAGFLFVWMAWQAGWIVVAAAAVGIVLYLVVRALEGELDVEGFADRFRSQSQRD